MKIAVIFHRFGPYHVARIEAAARAAEITAIELSEETAEYDWAKIRGANGYRRITLFAKANSRTANPNEVVLRITQTLNDLRPDVVALPGWSDRAVFAALRWSTKNGVPAILMSESTAHDEPRVGRKEFVKRRIVNIYSTALVGGRLHSEYLQQLGMPAERIFTGYDVVDNAHFARGKAESGKQKSEIIDSQLSTLNPQRVPFFLASARFIEKKNLPTLIRAYAQYRKLASDLRPPTSDLWNLVILGDGPLRSDLCSLFSDLSLRHCVLLPGFKQYDELPSWYARASAFIHASTTEQWGLVVNEAAAAELPLIVSNRCGCAPELVQEGVNGFTFDPFDLEALANCLCKMAALPPNERSRMGARSREIVTQFVPDHFGEGLLKAAKLAVQLPRKRAGLVDRALLGGLSHR